MIKHLKCDVTTVTAGTVLHGVNCSGRAMNSGVAKAIRNKWPEVYEDFIKCGSGKQMLGAFSPVKINDDLTVGNCYTQEFYGRDGKRYASLFAIETSLRKAFELADFYEDNISMPKIGCGLGGLDWDTEVKPIVERLSTLFDVNVYVYEI